MPERIANLEKTKTKRRKNPRKPGRKPAAASKRQTPPGTGAVRLRRSINSLVSQKSDQIANALVEKTVAGDMAGARILVELSGADKPLAEPKKKRGGKTLLDELESGPQWDPSMGRDASQLPPSEPDDPDDEDGRFVALAPPIC